MDARTEILARIRAALAAHPASAAPVPRGYRRSVECPDPVTLLTYWLREYRATVHHCRDEEELPAVLGSVLAGSPTLVVPGDLPERWLARYRGRVRRDGDPAPLSVADLDAASAVLTGCALAIAETGTIVLDAGPLQGRRALTLVPDHHVCVVRAGRIVPGVPEAIAALSPARPLTWISGPSATSDIELDRVEGVHGPRRLDVVLVGR